MFGRRSRRVDDSADTHDETTTERTHRDDVAGFHTETPREKYGGFTFGAAFFGWLVAVALTVLLAGIVGAVAAGTGVTMSVTPTEAERAAGTIGLATAIALLVILLISYFAGGYVAGRMSRFDGGRQGFGVWLLGLLVSIVVAALGAIFGTRYNVFEQANMPSVPMPTQTITAAGIVTLVVLLVLTLLAAMLGGKAGQRYHTKIDRAASL